MPQVLSPYTVLTVTILSITPTPNPIFSVMSD